jgi:hypothetical protein
MKKLSSQLKTVTGCFNAVATYNYCKALFYCCSGNLLCVKTYVIFSRIDLGGHKFILVYSISTGNFVGDLLNIGNCMLDCLKTAFFLATRYIWLCLLFAALTRGAKRQGRRLAVDRSRRAPSPRKILVLPNHYEQDYQDVYKE